MARGRRLGSEDFDGRFRAEREVHRNPAGAVYRAWDQVERAWVALKVLESHDVAEAADRARFEREGRVLAALDHPNIVRLLAWGTFEDETPFLAMEWLDGEDLRARMRRGPVPLGESLEIARQVAAALATAHALGVIHRDVKPSNIVLVAQEASGAATPAIKLVDFGIALERSSRVTAAGTILGTPAYMAPEQARAEAPVDVRADLYSVGATLFELVTGRPPHLGPTAVATLARLVTTRAPRASELTPVPRELDSLLARLVSTEPEDRPRSAREVEQLLESLLEAHDRGVLTAPPPSRLSQAPVLGTRLVTAMVGLHLTLEARAKVVEALRARGADTAPFGHDAVIAYVGARRSFGGEAARALEMGRLLASQGAHVGVATGRTRVSLSRPEGEVVDRAATLAHAAEAGQILADTTTVELARARFEFQIRSTGSAAVGERLQRRAEGPGGAPFVGREAELAQVCGAYARSAEDETPVVIAISGPPGIGKSRLGREALARIGASVEQPRLVAVRCDPFGRGQSLGVAADLVRALLTIHKGVSLEAAEAVVAAAPPSAPLAPELRNLVARLASDQLSRDGQEPRGARDQLWVAMAELMLGALDPSPVVCALEDAQWADVDSVQLLDHLVCRASGRPLCLLLLARPEFFRPELVPLPFSGRDLLRVDLRPLPRRATRAIARALLPDDTEGLDEEAIALQAAGSPLFAEELARLTSLGRSTHDAPTLEAAIQVAVDGQNEPCREAIACLSVFGMAGWDHGLEALGIESAAERLRDLSAGDLVVEHAESRVPGAREWTFKHALVRDVVYASLEPGRTKTLHARAAAWLAQVGEDAARVAEHYELGALQVEAAVHWERAARHALSTNALRDAVRMAERALAHSEGAETTFARALLLDEAFSRLDPRAADRESAIRAMREAARDEASLVRTRGAEARYDHARGTGTDVTRTLAQVRDRARALDLLDEECRSTAVLAARQAFLGDHAAAEREAARLLDLAEERSLPGTAIDGWQTLAVVYQSRGDLVRALDARRSAVDAARRAGHLEREGILDVNVGFALTTMGARVEARLAIEEGLRIGHAIGSPEAVRHGRMNLLGWTATFGPDAAFDAELAEPRSEADAASTGSWSSTDRATLGVLYYRACELLAGGPDDVERALCLFTKTSAGYRATGNHDVLPVALGMYAEAELRRGAPERARDAASEARCMLERGASSLLNEAPVYLALHDAHSAMGDVEAAREALAASLVPLLHRYDAIAHTPYARAFLLELPHNRRLLDRARGYGLLPARLESCPSP